MARIWNTFTRIEKAILLCCALALAYFAGGFWGRAKSVEELPPVFLQAQQANSSAFKMKSASAPVTVHVAGEVRRPGVLRLPNGARVSDALKKVGGVKSAADLSSVNLAQKLTDGEQILVRARGEMPAVSKTLAAPANRNTLSAKLPLRPVNVNTASAGELETLPGIGPKTSVLIMQKRAKKRFRSLDDLDEVKGLGPKKLEKLKPFVTF